MANLPDGCPSSKILSGYIRSAYNEGFSTAKRLSEKGKDENIQNNDWESILAKRIADNIKY